MVEVRELLTPDGASQGWIVVWSMSAPLLGARLFETRVEAEAFANDD